MSRHLPPLNALRVFEVAARTGSYSAAARELNLTHGAVSRQLANLARWLNQPLFIPHGRRMIPTPHALAFAREISAALDHISDASRRYGRSSSGKVIRVTAPATFAMRWLIPRLDRFKALCPHVEVRVSTAFSTDPGPLGSFDLAIRREPAEKAHYDVIPLFTERNTVIVSPAYLSKTRIKRVSALEKQVLLTTETRPGDWEAWLAHAGQAALRPAQYLRFDHYFVTLQAAIDGLGFGIGPFPTLQLDCDLARIATPFPEIVVPGQRYYVWVPLDVDKPLHLQHFIDWLRKEE